MTVFFRSSLTINPTRPLPVHILEPQGVDNLRVRELLLRETFCLIRGRPFDR